MKLFTFSLFAIAIVFTFGCSTENPLCTDNFCVEGEIYAKSDLAEGVEYGELPIDDAVIFATLAAGTTPVETTPVEPADSASFDTIVFDAAAGGTAYVGETVTITAPIKFVFENGVTLATKNQLVSFFLRSPDAPEKLDALVEGKTYQFTIEITSITPPDEEYDTYAVFSNITDDAALVDITPVEVDVAMLVADVAADGTTYVGQTVKVEATVGAGTAELEAAGLALATNNNDVIWIVAHKDKATLDPYVKDQSYTFTLLIHSVTPPDPLDVDQYYGISSIFIEAE